MKRNKRGKKPRPVKLIWMEDGMFQDRTFESKYAAKEFRRKLVGWKVEGSRNISYIFPLERVDDRTEDRAEG